MLSLATQDLSWLTDYEDDFVIELSKMTEGGYQIASKPKYCICRTEDIQADSMFACQQCGAQYHTHCAKSCVICSHSPQQSVVKPTEQDLQALLHECAHVPIVEVTEIA